MKQNFTKKRSGTNYSSLRERKEKLEQGRKSSPKDQSKPQTQFRQRRLSLTLWLFSLAWVKILD